MLRRICKGLRPEGSWRVGGFGGSADFPRNGCKFLSGCVEVSKEGRSAEKLVVPYLAFRPEEREARGPESSKICRAFSSRATICSCACLQEGFVGVVQHERYPNGFVVLIMGTGSCRFGSLFLLHGFGN